jgi:hypothetical protein
VGGELVKGDGGQVGNLPHLFELAKGDGGQVGNLPHLAGRWLMILAGVFAFVWSIVRARVQSMTLDEADTYFWFVANSEVFYPFPNNHVLNTVLMWITTHAFGLSSLTARMPALLGAGLYIVACYFLCRKITDRFSLQFPLFVCLIFNPFILDFMVAARGYSLANAFLLVAIAIPVWDRLELRTACVLASLALGLSFASNFSFGFVDVAAFLVIAAWAQRRESGWRVFWLCVLPGFFAALLICGYTLVHMRKGDLYYGAHSLGEMTRSLVDASLYQLGPWFGGSLYKVMRFLKPRMLPALGILCVLQIVVTRRVGRLAAGLAGIVALTVVLHWLAFRFDHLALPLSRTGIFLLPLCTLFVGAIAAAPAPAGVARWLQRGITGVFICLACYFVLCLRLGYFKEYEYDRDVKDVYAVLARLNHSYGVSDVAMSGVYASPLNFYRAASGKESFPDFKAVAGEFPSGKAMYVMDGPFDRKFIEREGLVVIYQGESTAVVVAVRPDGAIPPVGVDTDILLRRRRAAY